MARSPYIGTYQAGVRPTVVHSPDTLVYINGETDLIGCPSCRRRFDVNKYVTQVTVDLSVESVPGSASISLSIPRHAIDDFFFEGQPVLTEMMEVEIYAKGFYLVEGVPQYYPIFWGLITEVSDAFDSGEHTVSISCADILKWWELCRMNINPSFTGASGQAGRSIFGNVFYGMNPYDVIWTVAQQAFGDVVVGSGSLVSLSKEAGGQKQVFSSALRDIMAYWEQRFSRIRSNLLLYGVNGTAVRGDTLFEAQKTGKGVARQPFASTAVRNANGGAAAGQMVFDPTDPSVVAYRTQFNDAGQVNFWQSSYQTKLELANAAKEAIGFELYMDVTGDIVFKPPFFNLDVLGNKPVSWIQDIDIINWDFSQSEAEVVTQIQMQGSYGGNVDYGFPEEVTPFTSVTDYHLLRKYGWRPQPYNSEFMGDPLLMFYHGMDILDRLNSRRHRGTVTIPMRPELRLGFPIYVAPKDQIWYIQGISHSIAMGGRATTTLTLTAKREKFFAPRGVGKLDLKKVNGTSTGNASTKKQNTGQDTYKYTSRQLSKGGVFQLTVGSAATLPPTPEALSKVQGDNPYEAIVLRHPKTGRAVGFPNATLVYTRPFQPQPEDLAKNAGTKGKTANAYSDPKLKAKFQAGLDDVAQRLTAQHTATKEDELRAKHLNNRYQYGLNSAGVYVYAHDTKKSISEMVLLPTKNLTSLTEAGKPVNVVEGSTALIRPISDERGFEVIGHFRYGRGVALRDGRLVPTFVGRNDAASVDLQIALTGDLFATLTAQSAGLTSVATTATNPADALARLQPDDLQTAGVFNPQTKTAEFVSSEPLFAETAPLGSPEQKGFNNSVEASQLSRALTLAEMTVVKQGQYPDEDCQCLLGRSELTFLSNGYKVKILRGTVPDSSSLFGVTPGSTDPTETQVGGSASQREAVVLGQPVFPGGSAPALVDPSKAAEVVNRFLFDLYSALDTPHQRLEQALRGTFVDAREAGSTTVTGAPTQSPLAPPFSPANRTAIGDPAALALQGSSAVDNLAQTWSDFGDKLRANTERARLQGEINRAQAELNALIRSGADEAEQAALRQQIRNDQLRLAQLPR